MTTIPEHRNAGKRKLERDDYGGGVRESVENDPKKPKLLPWRKVIDVRKWELLPAVVYELLALIKKSEKPNPDDGRDTQQVSTYVNGYLPTISSGTTGIYEDIYSLISN